MSTENTPGIERGAVAAERAIMGYTRPDGTYVQGAVNFWDDAVENGSLIARDVLAVALDVEELALAAGAAERAWALTDAEAFGIDPADMRMSEFVAMVIRKTVLGAES